MRYLLLITTLGCLLFPTAAFATKLTAYGTIKCYEEEQILPLAGAKIDIMNSNSKSTTLFDTSIGSGYIKSNGTFKVEAKGSDLFSKPDVYPRITLEDSGNVVLKDTLGLKVKYSLKGNVRHNATGSVNLNTYVLGTYKASSPCGVFTQGRKVYQDYVAEMKALPPYGKLTFRYSDLLTNEYPWTEIDSIQWPKGFSASENNLEHEFGHSIRHSLDGNLAVFLFNVTRFWYARNHDDCDSNNYGFAFNEGWAQYYSQRYGNCSDISDMHMESNVAKALTLISKCPEIDGRKGMIRVLAKNPRRIYSFYDFMHYAEKLYPSSCFESVKAYLPSSTLSTSEEDTHTPNIKKDPPLEEREK